MNKRKIILIINYILLIVLILMCTIEYLLKKDSIRIVQIIIALITIVCYTIYYKKDIF